MRRPPLLIPLSTSPRKVLGKMTRRALVAFVSLSTSIPSSKSSLGAGKKRGTKYGNNSPREDCLHYTSSSEALSTNDPHSISQTENVSLDDHCPLRELKLIPNFPIPNYSTPLNPRNHFNLRLTGLPNPSSSLCPVTQTPNRC